MSRVEDRALELYPIESGEVFDANGDIYESGDKNYAERFAYIKGYNQAEKDLELSWKDISKIICIDQQVCGVMGISDYTHNHQQAMEEVLKRFKDFKEKGT